MEQYTPKPSSEDEPLDEFEITADILKIPRENRDHPTMKELVSIYIAARDIQRRTTSGNKITEGAPGFLDIEKASLEFRYSLVDNLARVMVHVLASGIPAQPPAKEYIETKLGNVLRPFGLTITEDPQSRAEEEVE